MTRKIALPFISLTLLIAASGCSTRVDPPGDINVDSTTVQEKPEPGNILADERIKSVGE